MKKANDIMKPKVYERGVPFRADCGVYCSYKYGYPSEGERIVKPFYRHLTLTGMSRGRSAATAYFTDDPSVPKKYPMMFANFQQAMHHLQQVNPESRDQDPAVELVGWFYFRKQGANYGLVYAGKLESDIPNE